MNGDSTFDDCSFVIANIYQYVDGELTGSTHLRIVEHIENCIDCANKVHFQASFKLLIKKNSSYSIPNNVKSMIIQSISSHQNDGEGTSNPISSNDEMLVTHMELQQLSEGVFENDENGVNNEDDENEES